MPKLHELNGQERQQWIRDAVQKYHARGMHMAALQDIIRINEDEDVSITELELARNHLRRARKSELAC